jgi:hypothetical protein
MLSPLSWLFSLVFEIQVSYMFGVLKIVGKDKGDEIAIIHNKKVRRYESSE